MDFNEINKVNLSKVPHEKKGEKKPAEEKIAPKKENLKQAPNNPSYWQSTIGVKSSAVSFSGNKEQTDEFIEKQIAKIKSACYWGEDKRTCDDLHRQFMLELLPVKGEKCIKQYAKLANMGLQLIWQDKELEKYNQILQKICSEVQDFELYDANTLAHILSNITSSTNSEEYIANYTDILCKLFNNQNANANAKMNYMNNLLSYNYTKKHPETPSSDEVCENFDTYCDLISYIEDNEAKEAILNSNLTREDYKKIIALFQDKSIPRENFAEFITNNIKPIFWNTSPEDEIMEVIEEITADEGKKALFTRLTDKKTTSIQARPFSILKTLEKDLNFIYNVMDYLFERSEKEGAYCISSHFEKITNFFEIIDSSNLEDFKEFSKDMKIEDAFEAIKQYKNPKTGLFDIKIAEKQKELEKRGIESYEARYISHAGIDLKTGEFSEIAEDIIDIFYPLKDKGLKGKLKNFKTKLKVQSKICPSAFWDSELSDLLNSLKDKNNEFNSENQSFFYSLIKTNRSNNRYYPPEISAIAMIINNVKDENGVVDRTKACTAINLLRKTKRYQNTADILETFSSFPEDKRANIYRSCMNIIPYENIAISNFNAVARYCFDENGDMKTENFDFVKNLLQKNPIYYDIKFFDMCDTYPQLKDFFAEISCYSNTIHPVLSMNNIIEEYAQKDGSLDEDLKKYILEYVKTTNNLTHFKDLYKSCFKIANNDNERIFDKELFDKAMKLIGYEQELCSMTYGTYINGKTCIDILNEELSISKISFKDKVNLLNSLKTVRDHIVKTGSDEFDCLNKAISDVEASLSLEDISLPIDQKARINFIQNVLYSKTKQNELTEFENVITSAIPKLEEMTGGLKISYPRSKFLNDLNELCNSEYNLDILKNKTGIIPILDEDENGSQVITGYNGIIKLNELDQTNPLEKKIYDCMYKFMYNNEVQTDDKELNKQLNHIIKACPEFINVIGKKQHGTQRYTVDIHSLLVLAYSIANPDYAKKLNSLDRTILKVSAIFHDIMKQENIVDKGHQNLSSLYTKSIIKKIIKSTDLQDRIYELIDNHHWSEEYSKASDKKQKAQELAFRFRRPNDFEIAKIMARSDLKAVNDNFYESLKNCLEESNLSPIQENLDYIYSTGNAIFSSRIVSPKKLNNHTETKDGIEYKVINLHKLDDEADVGDYGFDFGRKKKDLKFLVHMVDSNSIYENLNTTKLLCSPLNGGVLSESLITPKYSRTYCNRKYGVLLSEINSNIVNTAKNNQSSGTQKDFSNIINLIFKTYSKNNRNNFKNELLNNLKIRIDEISDKEYAEFYKTVIAQKTSLTEINPNREFKIGKYTITGKQLIGAINKYQDDLIDKKESHHNEIVGYTPKIHALIAKEANLASVPDELLKFAHENNLPIILM